LVLVLLQVVPVDVHVTTQPAGERKGDAERGERPRSASALGEERLRAEARCFQSAISRTPGRSVAPKATSCRHRRATTNVAAGAAKKITFDGLTVKANPTRRQLSTASRQLRVSSARRTR